MTDTPSALAFRIWDLDRQNDRLISFNAAEDQAAVVGG